MKTTSDGRTRNADGLLLEQTQVATAIWGVAWEHQPRAPFRVQRFHEDRGIVESWNAPDIEYAAGLFVDAGLPMEHGRAVLILDETFSCILGNAGSGTGWQMPTGMAWWGTAAAFRVLERWSGINPMDLAVWESIARGYV